MSGFFNFIWFVVLGGWSALCFLVLSGVFAITIIGIPIAKSLLQFAKLNAFPYGKEIIKETELKGTENVSNVRKVGGVISNILWFPIGITFTLIFFIAGLFAFITIIGIPVGIVYIRMGKFLLFPIGAKVVSKKQAYASAVANELEKRNK